MRTFNQPPNLRPLIDTTPGPEKLRGEMLVHADPQRGLPKACNEISGEDVYLFFSSLLK